MPCTYEETEYDRRFSKLTDELSLVTRLLCVE